MVALCRFAFRVSLSPTLEPLYFVSDASVFGLSLTFSTFFVLRSTIFVVGAGRGPLVAGCIRAAERSGRRIKITAVEKNANAFVVYVSALLPSLVGLNLISLGIFRDI